MVVPFLPGFGYHFKPLPYSATSVIYCIFFLRNPDMAETSRTVTPVALGQYRAGCHAVCDKRCSILTSLTGNRKVRASLLKSLNFNFTTFHLATVYLWLGVLRVTVQ